MNHRFEMLRLIVVGFVVALPALAGAESVSLERWESARNSVNGFSVESVEEFARILEYHDQLTDNGARVHGFTTRYGAEIACVDIRKQAAVRAAGLEPESIPLAPTVAPLPPPSPSALQDSGFGLDGSLDERGRTRACPEGSFPKRIPPVESLYRFRRLDDLYRKYPPDLDPSRAADNRTITHEYGIVFGLFDNLGEAADFNLWAPQVENDGVFSLTQLWVARGEGDDLQTAEAGWQVLPAKYGNRRANLFIFYTANAYQSGCYNLDCDAFVQTDATVVLGAPIDVESELGGEQTQANIGWVLDGAGGGDWWLTVNGRWVGFYPSSLFDNEGIASGNSFVNFGGELINAYGTDQCASEMGSGRFPEEGYGRAAYIRRMQYLSMDGDWADAENLSVTETRPECWGAGDFVFDEDEAWRSHFFYGGACEACDGCVTSGMCVPVGAVDPKNPCVLCAASGTWANNDGGLCDDNEFCNGDDSCMAGSCAEHNGDPCAEGDWCIEETDSCEAPDSDDDAGDPIDPDDDEGAADDQEDADRSVCGC